MDAALVVVASVVITVDPAVVMVFVDMVTVSAMGLRVRRAPSSEQNVRPCQGERGVAPSFGWKMSVQWTTGFHARHTNDVPFVGGTAYGLGTSSGVLLP